MILLLIPGYLSNQQSVSTTVRIARRGNTNRSTGYRVVARGISVPPSADDRSHQTWLWSAALPAFLLAVVSRMRGYSLGKPKCSIFAVAEKMSPEAKARPGIVVTSRPDGYIRYAVMCSFEV